MIYLQEGNFPLNEAFSSEIVQEANSTYQLTFKFPTSDSKWASLTPETELVADDLHGEQYFTIFEVEKQHGYITVYANQVATLLNGYSINKINVDRVNGATVMNALVAGFKRETPFTFFSDVMSKHTLNLKDISAMEALAKDKHSIVGQWGGDLVRDKYSVRLLENGGIENESLFAYKKNMKSFQESKSTKELRTRIHFKKVIEAHEEGKKDQILTVTIDSPLINKYKHIYEADMEVQDQDVVDQKTLEEYGKRYFRETLCDMIEESLEIDVVGQADQPVHMFDIVSIFHEGYDVDLRKKITKYKFNPMSIKLVSIGFGEVTRTLADSISGMVNDSVDKKMKSYDAEYEAKVQRLVDNANAEYDKQAKELEHKITDGIEQAKAQAEVVKQEINGIVAQKILESKQLTDSEIAKANAKAEEALDKAGTIPDTATLSDQIKTLILNSPDLSRKVTETFNNADNGDTIYSKIISKVATNFATTAEINSVQGSVNNLSDKIAKQTVEFNKLTESNKLYERILGTSETDAPDRLSRLVMSSDIFQTEVGKYVNTDGANLLNGSKGPFKPDKKPANFDNNILYKDSTSIYMEQGQEYTISAKTDGNFTAHHDGLKESDNVVLWIMDKDVRNYQIVSDLKTGTTGTKITWNKPTGTYHLRVNTYRKDPDKLKSVWDVKIEKGSIKSDYTLSLTDQLKADPLIEATRTQVTQLAGSYAIKNINSAGDIINGINLGADGNNRFVGKLTHITGETQIDNAVIKSAMVDKLKTGNFESGSVTTQILASNAVTADKLLVDSAMINKLVTNQAFIRELTSQKAFITQLASIDISANRFTGDRIQSSDGSLVFDLVKNQLTMLNDTAAIVREDAGYPTHFIRYESAIENGQRHSRTIIGSNRNGSKNWNSVSFAGFVIDNNSNNAVDKIFQYGDYNHMRHASSDEGWNFSVVTQILTPGIWNKNSEIWCRHFVIPKKTKSETDNPTEFIRLDESVAALWKLWAHALGQIGMTEAMKTVIQRFLNNFGYSRPHI
nr:MAG TPA: Neck appendage protein [Caudoviricetes sp.]